MTQQLKAILVEDEPAGMKNLRWKLKEFCPEIEIIAECANGKTAIKEIKRFYPDVVFLDVQLGDMSGFDVLQEIPFSEFEVVFTTAHGEYAIDAFHRQALHFLLKPVKEDELKEAVNRLVKKLQDRMPLPGMVSLPVSTGERLVHVNQILYLETINNRCQAIIQPSVNGGGKTEALEEILLTSLLKDMQQRLERHGFCRPNQATLVNLLHMREFIRGDGGWVIMSNGKHINISPRYREKFNICRNNRTIRP